MHIHIDISGCPKCRHAWAYSVIYQRLSLSGKYVIQHLLCDYCPYSTKRTVRKGQEDPTVGLCTYDCVGHRQAYSEIQYTSESSEGGF
jgi:C4-type Zn-finger protein